MLKDALLLVLNLDLQSIEEFPETCVNILLFTFCLGSLTLETPRIKSFGEFLFAQILRLALGSGSNDEAEELEEEEKAAEEVSQVSVSSHVTSSEPVPAYEDDPAYEPVLVESMELTQAQVQMEIDSKAVDEMFEEFEYIEEPYMTEVAEVATITQTPTATAAATISQAEVSVATRISQSNLPPPIPPGEAQPTQPPPDMKCPPPAVPTKKLSSKSAAIRAAAASIEAATPVKFGPPVPSKKSLSKTSSLAPRIVADGQAAASSQAAPIPPFSAKKLREVEKSNALKGVLSSSPMASTSSPSPSDTPSSKSPQNGNSKVPPSLRQTVHKAFPYPSLSGYERALRYLESCCSPTVGYQSRISDHRDLSESVEIKTEIFTSALIYDVLAHLPGISAEIPDILLTFISKHTGVGVFNKFVDRSIADDVDTTSVCLWALLTPEPDTLGPRINLNSAKAIAKILTLNNNEGGGGRVIQALIPPYPKGTTRVEIDVAAIANVMRVLYFLGMESGAKESEDYAFRWLHNSDNFTQGTPLYHSADAVLYFLSNSLTISKKMKTRFSKVMMVRLLSNLGKSDYPLDLALRIMTAYNLGMYTDSENFSQEQSKFQEKAKFDILKMEIMKLRKLQLEDGSWPLDAVYRYDSFYFGSKAAITAFATKALFLSRNISNF